MLISREIKITLFVSLIFLCGCNHNFSNIWHHKSKQKQVGIQFSSSVILSSSLITKNIFVQLRNSACQQFAEKIEKSIILELKHNGFKIVSDPIDAEFLLQANLAECKISNMADVKHTVDEGYGSIIHGSEEDNESAFALTTDKNMVVNIIADLQISERVLTSPNQLGDLKHAAIMQIKPWKQYQTRVAITKQWHRSQNFNSALPLLIDSLAIAITEIFIK